MRRTRWAVVLLVGLLVVAAAEGAHYELNISLSAGGSGTISFDYPGECSTCFFANMTNLQVAIATGSEAWDEADILYKYGLFDHSLSYYSLTDWFVDDGQNGSSDTCIVSFDNGSATLCLDEGDEGSRSYSIGATTGQYAIDGGIGAIPTLSTLGLLSLALCVAGLGIFLLRRTS